MVKILWDDWRCGATAPVGDHWVSCGGGSQGLSESYEHLASYEATKQKKHNVFHGVKHVHKHDFAINITQMRFSRLCCSCFLPSNCVGRC